MLQRTPAHDGLQSTGSPSDEIDQRSMSKMRAEIVALAPGKSVKIPIPVASTQSPPPFQTLRNTAKTKLASRSDGNKRDDSRLDKMSFQFHRVPVLYNGAQRPPQRFVGAEREQSPDHVSQRLRRPGKREETILVSIEVAILHTVLNVKEQCGRHKGGLQKHANQEAPREIHKIHSGAQSCGWQVSRAPSASPLLGFRSRQ